MKEHRWNWIKHEGEYFYNIGVEADGSLYNPRQYPESIVRCVIAAARERKRERRSTAAKKASETRRRRREKRVYEVARRIVANEVFGPRQNCFICGRGLDDPQSVRRGIGSECWQDVLDVIPGNRRGDAEVSPNP